MDATIVTAMLANALPGNSPRSVLLLLLLLSCACCCSYFAHTIRMQLHPNMKPYTYKVYVTVGRIGAMRQLFAKILRSQPYSAPAADHSEEEVVPGFAPGRGLSPAVDVAGLNLEQQQQHPAGVLATEPMVLGRNPLFVDAAAAMPAAQESEADSKDNSS
jgi:hypothetical protein